MGIVRLLLAAAIVLGHSSPIFGQTLGGGVLAVNCFFVISGFYMAMVLQKKYLRLPTRQWKMFMSARLLRLMPVYLTVCLATLAVVIKLGDRQPFGHFADLSAWSVVVVVVSNVTLLGQDAMLFLGVGHGGAPFHSRFLVRAAPGIPLHAHPTGVVCKPRARLLCACTATRSAQAQVDRPRALGCTHVAPSPRLDLIRSGPLVLSLLPHSDRLLPRGMIAYRCNALPSLQRRITPLVRRWGAPTALVSTVALLFYAQVGQERSPAFTFVAPYFVAFLVPAIFSLSKNSAVDRWIGDLSYPLYLVHVLVLTVMHVKKIPAPGSMFLPVALVVSALLLVVVDHPVERYRQRRLAALIASAPHTEPVPIPHAMAETVT